MLKEKLKLFLEGLTSLLNQTKAEKRELEELKRFISKKYLRRNNESSKINKKYDSMVCCHVVDNSLDGINTIETNQLDNCPCFLPAVLTTEHLGEIKNWVKSEGLDDNPQITEVYKKDHSPYYDGEWIVCFKNW